jgi:hypothetical protein
MRQSVPVNFGHLSVPIWKSGEKMKSANKFLPLTKLLVLSLVLGGCASRMIGERIGSDQIALAESAQVAKCQSKGKVNVSVMSEVAFYTRSAESVEANLLQMARNAAIDNGGDTVVKGTSLEYGKRTFEVYKCKP